MKVTVPTQKACDPVEGCDGERDDLRSPSSRLSGRDGWRYFAANGHCNDADRTNNPGWRIYAVDESRNEFKRCQCGAWRPIYGHAEQPNFRLATDIHFETQVGALDFINRYRQDLPRPNAPSTLGGIGAVASIVALIREVFF